MSREHVVPDWLKKVLPRTSEAYTQHGTRTQQTGPDEATFRKFSRTQPGNIGNRRLLMVCVQCNTKWMRGIQDATRPILTPLIRGIWDDFDEAKGAQIALWAAMTVCVISASAPDMPGVHPDQMKYMNGHRAVPPDWGVWIGRASGFEEIYYGNRIVGLPAFLEIVDNRIPSRPACMTTIVLGQVIIHVVSVPKFEALPHPVKYGAILGVLPIHPWVEHTLDWRFIPIHRANSPEFTALVEMFFGATRRMATQIAETINRRIDEARAGH